jgi:hypothetical protein
MSVAFVLTAPAWGQRRQDSALLILNAGRCNFGPRKVLEYWLNATLRIQLVVITLAAVAAAWFWAIATMTASLLYIHPSDWTDADLVRHLWHFRIIQPGWVGGPPQYDYLRWTQAEALARLGAVFLGWLVSASCLIWRHTTGRTAYGKGRTPTPERSSPVVVHLNRYIKSLAMMCRKLG